MPGLMDSEQVYQETLNYLYSYVDYSLTHGMQIRPGDFELGRMFEFMDYLGNPQRSYPIIHVAGTKGKGSVCALCASALQAAGYRVGLYTSPHLQDYAERIQINGTPIAHSDLVALVQEVQPYLERGTKLTTFEITTALAFLHFARQGATAVVAEVGLGGRLDATNVVTPVVSVITSLSYDHMQILGNTLTEIAGEKAGIIKPGVPVVVSPQPEEARVVLERVAAERKAPLTQVGRDVIFALESYSLDGQSLSIHERGKRKQARLTIPFLGAHQVENAATAYTALQVGRAYGLASRIDTIRKGFSQAIWPGRFEVLQRQPPVVVDSAHNRDSARRLRQALDDYFPERPVILIFGVSEDKDVEGILAELAPRLREVIATRSFHPRAMEPERLVELVRKAGQPARAVEAIEEALAEALNSLDDQAMVLAAGSIFIAAATRHTWYNRTQ
jgi:dihydrofolate synthase/folylpolyglutamate synthase